MPHVILVAPQQPASQRRYLRGLVKAGALVSGVGQTRPERLEPEVRHLLHSYEHVHDLRDEDAFAAAVRRIQERGPWVDRLETTGEEHLLPAARARARSAIPGLSVEQALFCSDKLRMKEHLAARGVPCARHTEVSRAEDLARFVAEVGYPVVLKPRVGSRAADSHRIDDAESLELALAAARVEDGEQSWVAEAFVEGHEGFYDTVMGDDGVAMEFASHYYPTVLEAMHTRWISPQVVHTNRLHQDGYDRVRELGQQVIGELGLRSTATHMEWFHGPGGHHFSEIGARPPSSGFWDVYSEANEIDVYTEWARVLVRGKVEESATHRFAAGLINLRPSQDGVVRGYSGVERMQRAYGEHIFRMHLPPPRTPTQPIGAGYLANAWVCVKHPDYDELRGILDDIGRTVQVWAG
ncbi:MAG: ATP-grasp domain-containing protein [Myxococcales bacterium]|nr:ATP-grasp domain-containing protein [Myxococcales bacterium]